MFQIRYIRMENFEVIFKNLSVKFQKCSKTLSTTFLKSHPFLLHWPIVAKREITNKIAALLTNNEVRTTHIYFSPKIHQGADSLSNPKSDTLLDLLGFVFRENSFRRSAKQWKNSPNSVFQIATQTSPNYLENGQKPSYGTQRDHLKSYCCEYRGATPSREGDPSR